MDNVKILEVKQSIFASNDEQAAQLRQSLKEKKIFLLNLMSAPGSGKTTTLRSTIAALKDDFNALLAALRSCGLMVTGK